MCHTEIGQVLDGKTPENTYTFFKKRHHITNSVGWFETRNLFKNCFVLQLSLSSSLMAKNSSRCALAAPSFALWKKQYGVFFGLIRGSVLVEGGGEGLQGQAKLACKLLTFGSGRDYFSIHA